MTTKDYMTCEGAFLAGLSRAQVRVGRNSKPWFIWEGRLPKKGLRLLRSYGCAAFSRGKAQGNRQLQNKNARQAKGPKKSLAPTTAPRGDSTPKHRLNVAKKGCLEGSLWWCGALLTARSFIVYFDPARPAFTGLATRGMQCDV